MVISSSAEHSDKPTDVEQVADMTGLSEDWVRQLASAVTTLEQRATL